MISTNNLEKSYKILLKVVKNIFCDEIFEENCKKCSLCHLIDMNNLPSLRIIEPDNNIIKKEQILNLKSTFSKSSQITSNSVYIIKNCEKMNKESANTLLKFLEEPIDNVYGFFITNNIENVISTIQSRCQIIEEHYNNELYEELGINTEEFMLYYEKVNNYLQKIECEQEKLIVYNREYLFGIEKNEIIKIFQIILNIYQSLLINKEEFINKYPGFEYLKKYNQSNIISKVNLIIEFLQKINYNVNIDLLLDKFVIEMDVINHEDL